MAVEKVDQANSCFSRANGGMILGISRWSSRRHSPSFQTMQITKLTDNGAAEYVAISPDGRFVLYPRRDGEKLSLWLRQTAAQTDVQILPPAVVHFQGLSFTSDRTYIYFVRSDSNNLYVKSAHTMPMLGGCQHHTVQHLGGASMSQLPAARQITLGETRCAMLWRAQAAKCFG